MAAEPAGKKVVKERMPNPVRSARTREKLLNATIQCLYELGYDQTSTVLVTKRAGVSRGAMLHQFPSKADLMLAVFNHISDQRVIAHREALEGLRDPREILRKLIDISWSELSKPNGIARVEIMLASRSDKEIGERFSALNEALQQRHRDWMWRLAQKAGVTDQAAIETMAHLYASALRGLAIDALDPAARPRTHAAIAMLRDYQNRKIDELIAEGTAARASKKA